MEINIREKDDIIIVDIEGGITRSTITDITLHQIVKNQLDIGKRNILLNLEKVDSIDSFGVGEILASYISTHNLGGNIKIVKLPAKYHMVFQVTMLSKVLEIFDEEDQACNSFLKM
jgi:anti-anti-sigma factor